MRKTGEKRDTRGSALLLVLMILIFLTILAMFALYAATRSIDLAGRARHKMEAFYTADAGINRAVADLLRFYKVKGSFAVTPFDMNLDGHNDDLSSELPGTVSWAGLIAPSLQQWLHAVKVQRIIYFAPETACFGKMETGNCIGFRYEVRIHLAGSYVRVLSLARYHEGSGPVSDDDKIVLAMENIVRIVSGSACDTGIFIGGPKSTQAIAGSLEVHGGLNILCEETDPGLCAGANPPSNCSAIATGASVGVYNNYDRGPGQAPSFINKIQPLNPDENQNPTLNAKVLVQNCGIGQMGMSSNIGAPSMPMDAVVADGGVGSSYGEVSIADDARVHGREKHYGAGEYLKYLGAEAAAFPMLSTPEGFLTTLGGDIFYMSRSNNLPAEWCNITPTTPSMGYGPQGCACPGGCSLCWDSGNKTMTSNRDTVYNLSGCAAGATLGDLMYKGKGSFYYGQNNVTIDGNVTVADRENFPMTSAFGFMTAGEMNIAPSNRSEIMGLFYAQNKITMTNQTAVAGIVISNSFNLGSHVPEIYQVPSLNTQAPAGFREMCGGQEKLAPNAWRVVY